MKKQYTCTGKYLRFLKYLPCMYHKIAACLFINHTHLYVIYM